MLFFSLFYCFSLLKFKRVNGIVCSVFFFFLLLAKLKRNTLYILATKAQRLLSSSLSLFLSTRILKKFMSFNCYFKSYVKKKGTDKKLSIKIYTHIMHLALFNRTRFFKDRKCVLSIFSISLYFFVYYIRY